MDRRDVELAERYHVRYATGGAPRPVMIDLGATGTLWWYVPFEGSLEPDAQTTQPFLPRWSESYFAKEPKGDTVVGVFLLGTTRAFHRALEHHRPRLVVSGLTKFL